MSTAFDKIRSTLLKLERRSIDMGPRIVTLEKPIKIVGVSTQTRVGSTGSDITRLWQRYMELESSKEIPNKKTSGKYYGISLDFNREVKSFTYFAGEEVTALENIPQGLCGFEIPAVRYAVFKVKPKTPRDFHEAIQNMLRYIYNSWLPNSGYEHGEGIDEFELYDERSHRQKNPEMEIYIPIK